MIFILRAVFLALLLSFGAVGFSGLTAPMALAQQPALSGPDYEVWNRTAQRAEGAIEASRASTDALETLRLQLVDWRAQFVAAQSVNANAIATIQSQIDALGPVPENGVEAPSVAKQRIELTDRLNVLQGPVKQAQLAENQAEGLITGVDRIIRERQAEELVTLGPSPLAPSSWAEGWSALTSTSATVRKEIVAAWNNPVQRAEAKEDALAVVVLLVLGLVLILRGRRWSRVLTNWVLTDQPGAGRWLSAFALSLGSIILPFIGMVMLTEAAFATNLVGLRGEQVVFAFIGPFLSFLLYRWIAMRIFPAKEARTLPLNLTEAERHSGRWNGALLGLISAGYFFFSHIAQTSGWNEAATHAVLFPFFVLAGVILLRLARLLRSHTRHSIEEEGEDTFRTRITRVLALGMSLVAIAAPVLAAVGYFKLADFVLFPFLLSILLLSALLILQRLVVELYVLITGNREKAGESLVPVLVGLVLVIASLPLFALAWGARPAQLYELWTQFTEGINLGGVRISPTVFLTFAMVFTIGYVATRLLQGALKNTILPKTRIDQGGRNAIVSGAGYIGIFLAAVVAITSAGLDLSSIAIVAGALSVGIGFGLRTIVENFVSGIILLIERPISEGDWIEVGGVHGTVRDISVRSTRIETFDRSDVILPNADLVSGRVTNYTRGNTVGRVIVPVGVAYGADTRRVAQILQEIAEAHPMVLANPAPYVVFKNFGASSLDFEIRAILRDVNWILSVHSEMNHQIAERFAEEGIEIPFAQRDIWIRNPEALLPGAKTAADKDVPPDPPKQTPKPPAESDGDVAGDGGER